MDNKIKVLDCTLRDGGYYNSWDFDSDLVKAYLTAVDLAGVDIVELGFRSMVGSGFKGLFGYTLDEQVRALCVPEGLTLGVMVNASELVRASTLKDGVESLFPNDAGSSRISLVRIACHLQEVDRVLPAVDLLKEKGFFVGLNLMQISGQSEEYLSELIRLITKYPVDVLYFADSLGSMTPEDVSDIVRLIRAEWKGPIGIHTHDNLGLALQNSLRAIDAGVEWIDATVTGMGRGPGNARTEELAIEVAQRRGKEPELLALTQLIRQHFKPLQNKHGWGTNPFYYLAGKYGIHPTYIQEMLSDSRYDETDILSVIDYLRSSGGRKYSSDVLEAARMFYHGEPFGTWSPEETFAGKDVLLIGAGPSVEHHLNALESFINNKKPLVLVLNTQSGLASERIDFRVACHPVRLLADSKKHSELGQPLIMPYSVLPEEVRNSYGENRIHDFGLAVRPGQFEFDQKGCVLPTSLVAAYALAIASSGKARRVLLAGFDGYGADDPRNEEMQTLLSDYQRVEGACELLSVTPTRFKIPVTSIYLL